MSTNLDRTPAQPGPELDALIAEKWMGWKPRGLFWEVPGVGMTEYRKGHDRNQGHPDVWSPSTNPGHAGEARRKAIVSSVDHCEREAQATAVIMGCLGQCTYAETEGSKGRAEALAICRAVVAAIQAKEDA